MSERTRTVSAGTLRGDPDRAAAARTVALDPESIVLQSGSMTLRSRLALAMMAAAVLPMTVMVGLPLLRAEKRAQADAAQRLQQTQRLAQLLVARREQDTSTRVTWAGLELSRDPRSLRPFVVGPEDAANAVARAIAERNGLDELDVFSPGGAVLGTSQGAGGPAFPGAPADLPSSKVIVRSASPRESGGPAAVAMFSRQDVIADKETLVLIGSRLVDYELVHEIAEITGQAARLLDGAGASFASAGSVVSDADRIRGEVLLGGGPWRIEVAAPAGDVHRQRHDLLVAFAGIAPFALLVALVVGALVAAGISRPIRALAERADEISSRRAGFALLERERDEVRRLRSSFDRMLESLADSEKQRLAAERIAAWQEVARRIAHEVKNPLSPIKLAVENLRRTREKAPETLDRALDEETTTILEEVESLRRLVDEFSQFARLPAPRPAACDPRELVQQALASQRGRIDSLAATVDLDLSHAPERIVADPEQIGRVLKNIIANALDALEPAPLRRLAIALRRGPRALQEDLLIEVQDSGVGFEPEALRRVFEPYYTTRGERGGTGLGMAIAYRIVAEHGGAIEARGAPGQGARITVRLPVGGVPTRRVQASG